MAASVEYATIDATVSGPCGHYKAAEGACVAQEEYQTYPREN